MDVRELLLDLFDRVTEHVHEVLDDIDPALLSVAAEPGANPIGWLMWHLTRVQDAQVAEVAGTDQVWTTGPWPARFALTADPDNHGYGHTESDVASVRPDGVDALTGYYTAVAARTRDFLDGLTAGDLDRVVDSNWDPPVTLGVRLISVADDDIQHAGQAAFVRGLLERR